MHFIKMGDLDNLGSLFTPIPIPPAVVDPTGGLLEPVIAPLNFVVTRMEEEVLLALSDAMILLRIALTDGTTALADASDVAFKEVNRIANDGLISALGSLQNALDLGGNFASIETIVGRIEKIATDAFSGLTQMANTIFRANQSALGSYGADIESTLATIKNDIRESIMAEARGALSDLDAIRLRAQARGTEALATLGRERDAAVAMGASLFRETTASARSEAGSALRLAEGRAREGVAAIRGARGRLVAGGTSLLAGPEGSLASKGELIAQKARLDAVEAAVRERRMYEALLVVGTAVAVAATMAYGYFAYIRPRVVAAARGQDV